MVAPDWQGLSSNDQLVSLEQSVVRVLILLCCAAPAADEPGMARRIDSNVKLQKLDFLLRNPDYLRQMLLQDAEMASGPDAEILRAAADAVQGSGEPEVLAERMAKFLYGPFEHDYESVYGFAQSCGLLKVRYVGQGSPGQREILLTEAGLARITEQVLPTLHELGWYARHAGIIGRAYGALDGTTLEQLLYARFPWIRDVPNLALIGPYEDSRARWSA